MSRYKLVKGKKELTNNDMILLDLVKKDKKRYKIVVDSDIAWVVDTEGDVEVGEFNSYGDSLVVSILESMDINAEYY